MKRTFPAFSVVVAISMIALSPRMAPAGIVVDLDMVTPGIQTVLTLPTGSTSITIPIFFDPALGGPTPSPVDGVGLDLGWATTGGASAVPTTPMLTGPVTAGAGTLVDHVTGAPLPGPGVPLTPAGLPALVPATANMGGAGHLDASGSTYGIAGPWVAPLDLMGATFTVSGGFGDTITFIPSGILPPGAFTPPGGPYVPGGDALTTSIVTIPQSFTGGTITFVPEPSSVALLTLLLGGLHVLRQRRRA